MKKKKIVNEELYLLILDVILTVMGYQLIQLYMAIL